MGIHPAAQLAVEVEADEEVVDVEVVVVVDGTWQLELRRLTTSCLMLANDAALSPVSCAANWLNFASRAGSRVARLDCAAAWIAAIAKMVARSRNIFQQ